LNVIKREVSPAPRFLSHPSEARRIRPRIRGEIAAAGALAESLAQLAADCRRPRKEELKAGY